MAPHDPLNPYDLGDDEDNAPAPPPPPAPRAPQPEPPPLAAADPYDFGSEVEPDPPAAPPPPRKAITPPPDPADDEPLPSDQAYDLDARAHEVAFAGRDELYAGDDGENADLAAMFIKKEKGEVGTPGLTIHEGAPPREPRNYAPLIIVAMLLAMGGLAVAGLTLVPRTVTTLEGERVRVPLWRYIGMRAAMPPEQRALQRLSDDELAFLLTTRSIERLYRGAEEFLARRGREPDSAGEIVAAGMARSEDLVDGWGGPYQVNPHGRGVEVRSSGRDGIFRNADDVVRTAGGLQVPAEFEAQRIEQTGEF